MTAYETALASLGPSFWSDLLESSRRWSSWVHRREWWHNKLYEFRHPNDGNQPQTVLGRNIQEVPYYRELLWPAPNGRFSLKSKPVGYFSQDFAVTCCEVIEQYRDNASLGFEELLWYLQGRTQPHRDWFAYPQSIRVIQDVPIADVCSPESALIQALARSGRLGSADDIFENTLMSWDASCRPATQAIEGVKFVDGVMEEAVA